MLVAAPALAHADLVSSTPEDGSELASPPTSVELAFSEGLDAGKSSFRLIGPDGDVGTGTASKDGSSTMLLDGLVLAPGAYRIKWTAAAEDGHVERGSLGFTVSAPTEAPVTPSPVPTTVPTAGATTTPTTAPPTEAPSTTAPTAQPASASPAGSPATVEGEPAAASGTDVLIPIVVGLVLVAGVGAFVLRRSRRV